MKAVVVSEFGGPEQLRLAEAADPVPGRGQVRIAVRAAGTNPVDAGNRADGSWAGLEPPCILGYDIAGVVESLGPAVTGLAPGDRVMAMTHFPDGGGGYAELAVATPLRWPGSGQAPRSPKQPPPRWPRAPRWWCCPGWRCRRAAACWSWAPAAGSGCSCCSSPPGRDSRSSRQAAARPTT